MKPTNGLKKGCEYTGTDHYLVRSYLWLPITPFRTWVPFPANKDRHMD
jgi:hypothetical protein